MLSGFSSPLRADSITVFAASSLTNSALEVYTEFSEKTGIKIKHSFAASSVLARQIINGAPVDVYISANTAWVDELERKGSLEQDSRKVILSNQMALIASEDTDWPPMQGGIIDTNYPLIKVINGKRIAIGDPQHVPVGIYTRQSLQNAGIWDDLREQFVGMPNARAVLALVERGESSFGFVYVSDTRYSSKVHLIGKLPVDSHDPIRYTAGVVSGQKHPNVLLFMEYLVSNSAQAIFRKHGFLPPDPVSGNE